TVFTSSNPTTSSLIPIGKNPMSMPPVHPQSVLPSELNIRDHLEIIRRRRDVFILVFLAALVVGIVSVSQSKPVYRTSAKLLVPASSYSLSVIDPNNPIGAMLAAARPDSEGGSMEAPRGDRA